MKKTDLSKKLPDSPGVYFFRKGKSKRTTPLYIGRATSLKDRTKSYFLPDIAKTRGDRIQRMVFEAKSLDVIPTDSVLEAIILEAQLIKKFQPQYNIIDRDDKSFNHVAITKEDYPRIILVRGRELTEQGTDHYKKVYGPFPRGTHLKEALRIVRKIFPFRDKCLPAQAGLPDQGKPASAKAPAGKPCFNRQIGLCPGVCTGEISKKEYRKIVRHIERFFEGKKKEILKDLEKEMRQYADDENFEAAKRVRDRIFSLNHIQDIALLKREHKASHDGMHIESYDIAHISGTSVVGAMCVIKGGILAKNDYRKFKMRREEKNDDVGNLTEMLTRRLRHKEWHLPDVIVVDGGKGQMNAARRVLAQEMLSIPVVGVVKGKNHKASKLIGSPTVIDRFKNDIVRVNEETHRFAIEYHKKVRARKLL